MKTLKVGVIGVGGIAKMHFPGWNNSPHTELVALSDPMGEVLNRVSDAENVALRFENPQDLINHPDIDIIDVCTPNMYHAPLSIAALDAGKHVICEKPLAPTPDDIRRMIEARDKSGKKLMTAQHFRFQGSSETLKAEIDGGVLGSVYHARSWMLRRNALPARPGFIYKKNSGGGPCIDIGVHILDLTLWMMGHPQPVAVTGVTQDKLAHQAGAFSKSGNVDVPPDMDVEEFAAAFVRFENGATLSLEVSWLLHHQVPNNGTEDMQMWLYGDKGGAHWPGNALISSRNETKQMFDATLQNVPNLGEPHARECMKFAEAIVNDAPSPVPAEQSLDVMSILDGLYRSAASGREVRLDD